MSKITTYSDKLNDWAIKGGQLISVYYNLQWILLHLYFVYNCIYRYFYLLPKHTYNTIRSTFCSISNKNISSMNMNKKSVLIRWKWMIKKSRSYSKDCMIKLCLCLYMLQCTNINLINSCILWLNFWEKKLPYLFEIFKVDEMKKMSTFPL